MSGILKDLLVAITSALLAFFLGKKEKAPKTPTLQAYRFDNDNTMLPFLEEVLKCNFKYILTYKNREKPDCENSLKSKTSRVPIFRLAKDSDLSEFVKTKEAIGLCFYNRSNETVLKISSMISNDGEFCLLNNETMLCALKYNGSVCILCDVADTPKSFSGSFENRGISYKISEAVTAAIKAKYKIKK